MKRYKRWFWMVSVALFFSMVLPVLVQAQGFGGDPDNPPCVGPDPYDGECPIDSGLVFLLCTGVAYGIKKVIDARKSKVEQITE